MNLRVLLLLLFCLTCNQFVIGQTIQFSGITWDVRTAFGGPGPNNWSASANNVWVDSLGHLHLKITYDPVTMLWNCAEVSAQQSFGYGEYRFYVASNVEEYDKNIVGGLFTYENDFREIDIEFAKWADSSNVSGWYTVQPPSSTNQDNFALNLTGNFSTHKIVWQSTNILFRSYHGHYPLLPSPGFLINDWTYTGSDNPPTGNERLHINFWLFQGMPPGDLQEEELIIYNVAVPSQTAVNELPNELQYKLFPNPANHTCEIQTNDENDFTVDVYNSAGEIQLKKRMTSDNRHLNVSTLPAGNYNILIKKSESENTRSLNLVKL